MNQLNSELCRPGVPQSKKSNKRKVKELLETRQRTKNMWNMRVTMIPIVIGALGTVLKDLERGLKELEIGGQLKQHCWDSPEYWEKYWRPKGTCCNSDSTERTSANAGVKNLLLIIIIIICRIVDFAIPADHKVKLKGSEKRDKCLDLARELKKILWNREVKVITIVIGNLTVTKRTVHEMEGLKIGEQVETLQTTALLRLARILRRVLETRGDLLSLRLLRKILS